MILASRSPRRIELCREAGLDPRVEPADVDEAPVPGESPFHLVERLARAKAAAIAARAAASAPGELVLAADTIVSIDGELLGKPADEEGARAMLARLSGRTHQVATGVALMRAGEPPAAAASFVEVTDVAFYPLTEGEIAAYVATGEPMDKAGAYGIQGAGGRMLVRGIHGDFYNVVGLPIAAVMRRIRAMG